MKTTYIYIIALLCFVLAGCEYDNFEAPKSTLSGKVVYKGNPVGIRTNGPQLELWEDGHELYTKIPVYIAHDGTYSASLFDGQYKLVRLSGAPWEPQSRDTVIIDVKGNTVQDIEVVPYFILRNESFQKGGSGSVTAKFIVDKVVTESELAEVRVYFGKSILTDQNKHEFAVNADIATVNIGQETVVTATLPAQLAAMDYVFVRIGVRSNKTNEFYYSQIQKL